MSKPLDGERTVSGVAKGKKARFTPTRQAAAIAIGAAVVVGFIIWKDPGHKKEDPEPPAPPAGIGQSVTYDPPKPQPMPAAYQPMTVQAPAPPPLQARSNRHWPYQKPDPRSFRPCRNRTSRGC